MARKDKAVTKTKKKTAAVVILLLIFALLAVFAILYLRKASYYKEHFYTGTTINGYDCSDLTVEEAEALLQQNVNGYVFELTDKDSNSYSVTGADLGLQYVSNGEAASLLELQKPL